MTDPIATVRKAQDYLYRIYGGHGAGRSTADALDAVVAEIEQRRRTAQFHKDNHLAAEKEIERQAQEIAALRADAERYRWLRAEHEPADLPIAQVVWKRNSNPYAEWVNMIDGNDLDGHIDVAIDPAVGGDRQRKKEP